MTNNILGLTSIHIFSNVFLNVPQPTTIKDTESYESTIQRTVTGTTVLPNYIKNETFYLCLILLRTLIVIDNIFRDFWKFLIYVHMQFYKKIYYWIAA